jgi:hypothetical protein
MLQILGRLLCASHEIATEKLAMADEFASMIHASYELQYDFGADIR